MTRRGILALSIAAALVISTTVGVAAFAGEDDPENGSSQTQDDNGDNGGNGNGGDNGGTTGGTTGGNTNTSSDSSNSSSSDNSSSSSAATVEKAVATDANGKELTEDALKEMIKPEEADPAKDEEAAKALELAKASEKNSAVFDIKLPEGVKLENGAMAAVDVAVPEAAGKEVEVFHITEGKAVSLGKYKTDANGKFTFKTPGFSYFVVTWDVAGDSDVATPATGEFSALPIALLAVAGLGATGVVVWKKRQDAVK